MGAIAGALARAGWQVTGSDENPKPPMSTYLAGLSIPVTSPCSADIPPPKGARIVVGKRLPDDHPLLLRLQRDGRAWTSFPAFLSEHFLRNSRNVVVAGGVGKTTTTSMLAWILEKTGRSPDYLIGGQPKGLVDPARFAGAEVAVLEGDEYASSGEDPRPKFLHYHPEVVVVTNLLEDHPDLYDGLPALQKAFADLVGLLPTDGLLVLPDDDPAALSLAKEARCPVVTTGFSKTAEVEILPLETLPGRSVFRLDETEISLPMCGRMNMRNAAMAVLAARFFGVAFGESAQALASFGGVGKRQDARQFGQVDMVIDKATHPQAIAGLFDSLRQRYPGRRLVSFLQPRATGGRGWVYQREFPATLVRADLVILFPAYEHQPKAGQSWPGGPFEMGELATTTRQLGGLVEECPDMESIAPLIGRVICPGDVVVVSVPEQAEELREALAAALGAGRW